MRIYYFKAFEGKPKAETSGEKVEGKKSMKGSVLSCGEWQLFLEVGYRELGVGRIVEESQAGEKRVSGRKLWFNFIILLR